MSNCRAKFTVTKVAEFGDNNGKRQEIMRSVEQKDEQTGRLTGRFNYESTGVPVREITLNAVYDDGIPENKRFAEATPGGEMKFYLNNPALADEFKPGQVYYIDFTRAEK